ncbi:hypothetical protein [Methylobacterium sp. 1973]|uniref:hypothetical protein n=1 Tax=Methylobacterium sp. 1973 TaxID=3156421 RepID=UPI003399F12A
MAFLLRRRAPRGSRSGGAGRLIHQKALASRSLEHEPCGHPGSAGAQPAVRMALAERLAGTGPEPVGIRDRRGPASGLINSAGLFQRCHRLQHSGSRDTESLSIVALAALFVCRSGEAVDRGTH